MEILDAIKIILLSATPVIEQRGAIPLGIIIQGNDPLLVAIISFLGSLIPVPFILLLFNVIFKWLGKIPFFKSFRNFVERKVTTNSKKIEKYAELGLILFVAIPLPTTGLWTGSAVAAFLKLDFKKSLFCIILGGILSALSITLISILIPSLFGY